nr:Chain Ag, Mitochondrial ribosomal protein L51 / S25 / CI-B8 domain containing protein [Trypanosoma brucei]
SRNGELCLKKVIISYCPSNGAPNTRQFLATHLPHFHAKYPSVSIDLRPRLWPEMAITGVYRDGSERSYNTKNLSPMGIFLRLNNLVSTANDYDQPFCASHLHFQRRSVQGTWNPWLWNYETERRRTEAPQWRRKLSEKEWDYYVGQYSAQMKQEEDEIQRRVADRTCVQEQSTREVQERWKRHVV